METIFGIHHDTASLRERELHKNDKQEQLGLTNKDSVKNTIQKTTLQTKPAHQEPSKSFEKLGSIFRERFSNSPVVSPHSTPPTSRPSTPLSFDVQQSGDNLFFDQINSSSQASTPLSRTTYHDTKILQNVKKVFPYVGVIEGDI